MRVKALENEEYLNFHVRSPEYPVPTYIFSLNIDTLQAYPETKIQSTCSAFKKPSSPHQRGVGLAVGEMLRVWSLTHRQTPASSAETSAQAVLWTDLTLQLN